MKMYMYRHIYIISRYTAACCLRSLGHAPHKNFKYDSKIHIIIELHHDEFSLRLPAKDLLVFLKRHSEL